jgi:hypothetical protein
MNIINLFKKKPKINIIEEEFWKGNVLLLSKKRDYENFEEFKKKTSHLKIIQKKLKKIGTENGE